MRRRTLRPALDILLLVGNPHFGYSNVNEKLPNWLRKRGNVRRVAVESDEGAAWSRIRSGEVNTIILDPFQFAGSDGAVRFIETVREKFPSIVFVLWFANREGRKKFLEMAGPRFSHYVMLRGKFEASEAVEVLRKCESWHQRQFEFDVALSFAGEDRAVANELAKLLEARGVRVFYDLHEVTQLWGKDLYQHLQRVYRDKSRYCVVFASSAYAQKVWPQHELVQAQARALVDCREYILPLRIDETKLPGMNDTTGYMDIRTHSMEEICAVLLGKLGGSPA